LDQLLGRHRRQCGRWRAVAGVGHGLILAAKRRPRRTQRARWGAAEPDAIRAEVVSRLVAVEKGSAAMAVGRLSVGAAAELASLARTVARRAAGDAPAVPDADIG